MTKILLSANTDWYLYNFRLALARHLREQGYEVVLVSPPGSYVQDLERAGFRWANWQIGRQSLALWQEIPTLQQVIHLYRQERPSLVHHHTIKPVLYGTLAARLVGIPAIVNSITGRGYVFLADEARARWLRALLEPFYRLTLASSRVGVIFENDFDRQYFLDHRLVNPQRTWLINGVGVDPVRFAPQPEPEGPPVVLLPARMLWDKGVGDLVEAARLLKARVQVRVALAGNPDPGNPATISTSQLQAWHNEGVIEWWGFCTDMPATYNRSHIITLPTKYGEGVPTVLLEGAACGRPLVASDIPGCRDVVRDGENGFLVPPNDPEALAQALERLVNDPQLRGRMGTVSRQMVLDQFTHARVNRDTLHVYQQFLKAERAMPADHTPA